MDLAGAMRAAGAAAVLLEAVPAEVSEAVVAALDVPVIGCGAGPACHGHVVVTHDALGFNPRPPRFVPLLGDLAGPATRCYAEYVRQVVGGQYPAPEHGYEMPPDQKSEFSRFSRPSPRGPGGIRGRTRGRTPYEVVRKGPRVILRACELFARQSDPGAI